MSQAVLVIDDNPITRKFVRVALESDGLVVHEAADGATAMAMFRDQALALVLLDLLLPDTDGFALLAQLRALPGGVDMPVLAFSGLLAPSDEARVSSVGFDDMVTKPVEASRLVQIVRGHLPSIEPMPPRPLVPRTLVIADDDAVQRKLVGIRLQRAGFAVTLAADGEEALQRARETRPDAIVSDVLMPRLDGFGLCIAVRNDPVLSTTPVLLITNSYLASEDQALAARAGANALVVRTPELKDVLLALDRTVGMAASKGPAHPPRSRSKKTQQIHITPLDPDVERERMRRVMNQLERQVALNAGINQRYALLSAELSVLSGISSAVATQRDLRTALDQVLSSCFDAGGISLGALYLREGKETRALRYGASEAWTAAEVDGFFGHPQFLEDAMASQTAVVLPSSAIALAAEAAVLEQSRTRSIIIAPLGHQGQPMGALMLASRAADLASADRTAFALAVAGQISLALALVRSFDDKDKSEREAQSNNAVLRSILESMGDGVLVCNERGELTHSNGAAVELLGIDATAKVAEPWLSSGLYRADKSTPLSADEFPLRRALRGESVSGVEIFARAPESADGLWFNVNARPLTHDGAVVRGAVAVFRDITAEKASRVQLLVSDRMASLGTLAAGVGHEINNPLMAVLGNLEMALDEVAELAKANPGLRLCELVDEMRDAKEAAERVRNIVRDLKLFSRSDDEARGEVDIERTLESSIRMVWNEIRHRARLVRVYTPVPRVQANESRLGQVFLNIIMNAAQAIPEGRANQNEIRIGTSVASDGRVVVEIGDTGAGMPPDTLRRIFTPFFTTKPIGVGTGLGLAICHQLVTAIGGEIKVSSVVGWGTTFSIVLPPSSDGTPAAPVPTAADAAGRRGKILIIDDEVIVASTIRRALGDHDVTSFTDAHDAEALIASGHRFDLILCDLMMPTVTGMDFYEAIIEIAPDQAERIVFITGGAFTSQARAFLDRVPNQRLEKPFELERLRSFVNARVRGS